MIAETLRQLRTTTADTRAVKIAKGAYQYPRTLKELIKALKWLLKEK